MDESSSETEDDGEDASLTQVASSEQPPAAMHHTGGEEDLSFIVDRAAKSAAARGIPMRVAQPPIEEPKAGQPAEGEEDLSLIVERASKSGAANPEAMENERSEPTEEQMKDVIERSEPTETMHSQDESFAQESSSDQDLSSVLERAANSPAARGVAHVGKDAEHAAGMDGERSQPTEAVLLQNTAVAANDVSFGSHEGEKEIGLDELTIMDGADAEIASISRMASASSPREELEMQMDKDGAGDAAGDYLGLSRGEF